MKQNELEMLENKAQGFNYSGTPLGQPFEFNGELAPASGFAREFGRGLEFGLTISNTYSTTKVVALNAAFFDSLARLAAAGHGDVDAILDDGVILTDGADQSITVTPKDAKKSIYSLIEFTKRNPARITAMTIHSSTTSQFEQSITQEVASPFSNKGDKRLDLSPYFRPGQYRDEKIEVNLINNGQAIEMNDQNIVKFPIVSGATLSITFYFGGISNQAKVLHEAANMAHAKLAGNRR